MSYTGSVLGKLEPSTSEHFDYATTILEVTLLFISSPVNISGES